MINPNSPPFLVALVACMMRASMVPPLISGPSSSGFLYTRYSSTVNFSIRSKPHWFSSSFSFSDNWSALPVCSSRSGNTFAGSTTLTSVAVGDWGGDLPPELILGRCFGGRAGGRQLEVTDMGEGVRLKNKRGFWYSGWDLGGVTYLWDSLEGSDSVWDCDKELQLEIWLKEQDCVVGSPGLPLCCTQCWACVMCTECRIKSWSFSFDWQLPNISMYAITETPKQWTFFETAQTTDGQPWSVFDRKSHANICQHTRIQEIAWILIGQVKYDTQSC